MLSRWLVILSLILMGQVVNVEAQAINTCPPGTFLKHIGSVATGSTSGVSTTGRLVRASRVACGGTACIAGIYNADTLEELTDADVEEEPGAAANTSEWTVYDPPLSFTDGITVVDDGNVNALLLYECRDRP